MIGLPVGTKIWIAAGTADMRSCFNCLTEKCRRRWGTIRSADKCLYSVAGVETSSNYDGVLAMACACWPSD